MNNIAIQVENLGKLYKLGSLKSSSHNTLRETLTNVTIGSFRRFTQPKKNRSEAETIWALRGVSFNLRAGEVLGIIGRNGAGKSTLLKILSRITNPTEGSVKIHGRIASLLEVGTGFHPELTGRENIFLNGSILGMKRSELIQKFDAIVTFAEVEKFIDTPVKHYSSGMYVRLAFAVAAHLEPENLIIDEVLAVGDRDFQKKCIIKMDNVAHNEGRSVILVSHNINLIATLCQRVMWIDGGQIRQIGSTTEVVKAYLGSGNSASGGMARFEADATKDAFIEKIELFDQGDNITDCFGIDSSIQIRTTFRCRRNFSVFRVAVEVFRHDGIELFSTNSHDYNAIELPFDRGQHSVEVRIPDHFLGAGDYFITVKIEEDPTDPNDVRESALKFEVLGNPLNREETIILPFEWRLL